MNVDLTPELEAMIQEKIRSGLYNNQSEVVQEALRMMAEQERLREEHVERLRVALIESSAEADRGEFFDGPEVIEHLREFLRERRDAGDRRG